MKAVQSRIRYFFQSTKGLILVAIALISLVTAIFGMLSGPMQEFGISDVVIKLFGIKIVEAEREGRIILLYHSIAVAVVAIEVFIITGMLPMKERERIQINTTMTAGYMLTLLFGMGFGYFGHNYTMHGVYIVGLSLSFFAGVLLAAALWPWKAEYLIDDPNLAKTKKGVDLERMAFFVMALCTLGSAIFGAYAGASFGTDFQSFLAEDLIREPEKTVMQRSIIGHLHIMLTLIAIALALIVGRWYKFRGIFHKISMPLMIFGTIITSLGAWSVVWVEWAHTIIYGGSTMVLLAALFLVIWGWDDLIRSGVREKGLEKANGWQKLKALTRDPLKFGATWQMVYMNFTVSFIGIFMAVKLDEIFRIWPHRDERIILTGHWHILSALVATIILFYYADLAGLKGKARQWFGWVVIIGSDLAFGAVTVFAMKRLFVAESAQQGLVNWTMLLADIGLAAVLVVLAILMIWRLADLFKKKGLWTTELEETGYEEEIK